MRSSVVESYPSGNVDVRGQRYQPQYEPRKPDYQQPGTQSTQDTSKRHFSFAPAEGWLALFLLAVAAYCIVFSIIAVNWVGHTFILYWSSAAGLLVGLVVAKIRHMPQALLHLAACLIGHWLSIWLTSVIALHISWRLLIAGIGAVITDPIRLNNNQMVFLFYLSFLCFFLGYFGAWLIYRAHLPWLVALVYCSIFLINLSYVKQDVSYIVVVLLIALMLLIARQQLTVNLVQWKSEGLYTDRSWLRGITWRCMQMAAMFALIILPIGWMLPAQSQPITGVIFWNNLDNAWTNITQGHLLWQNPNSLFQAYQAPTNFFSDQLTIAGNVHLPTGEVLNYTSSAAPQYLAGFTFDHFDGHTWTSLSSVNNQNYAANALLPNEVTASFTSETTSITIVQPPESSKHYIFGPTQPSAFDISTTLYGDPLVSAWAQQGPLTEGEHYQVVSSLSNASPRDLSAQPLPQNNSHMLRNDLNYKALQAYYVQLPTDLPPQVWQTTQQWTRGATNTYDALKMLEAHLSDPSQFTYALDNPPVPNNVDAVAWLLQTRHGYCTYYATAMTIMARQLDIPTRIVNGFGRGHLDVRRKVWVVDGSDAHSWVQAYFPKFGWINFDPTPGYALHNSNAPRLIPTPHPAQPTPTRVPAHKKPQANPPAASSAGGDSPTPATIAQQNLLVGLSLGSLLCSILVFLLAAARYWWRNRYANSTFIAGTFWRVCHIASWVGIAPRTWQTPYEYNRTLCQHMPQEALPLWRLTELFVRERWASPHQFPGAPEQHSRELKQLWPGLRKVCLRLLWMKTKPNKFR